MFPVASWLSSLSPDSGGSTDTWQLSISASTKSCAMRDSAEVFANQLSYVAFPTAEEQAAVIPRQDVDRGADAERDCPS
jgi:hypothetical protein